MHIDQVLQRISDQSLEFIQQEVQVDYDQFQGLPTKFTYYSKVHQIQVALGPFPGEQTGSSWDYIVQTADSQTYALSLVHNYCHPSQPPENKKWILNYRVLGDEELMFFFREEHGMLVNMDLKQIADFHGHLCPDLVLGAKAVEKALDYFRAQEEEPLSLFVVAQNQTSALDAVQYLTGCTVGNQRLVVEDCGKHCYMFISNNTGRALELRMKPVHFHQERSYFELEEKVQNQGGTLREVSRMQSIISDWVQWLANISPGALFTAFETTSELPAVETCSRYLPCSKCGDLVQSKQTIIQGQHILCKACAVQAPCSCTVQ